MNIEITCINCHITFTLQEEYLPSKESLVCPNCSKVYPQTEFGYLKKGVECFALARKIQNNPTKDRIIFSIKA